MPDSAPPLLPGMRVPAPAPAEHPATMPERELPTNRLMDHGADYLADSELLSLLLPHRSPEETLPLCRRILATFGSLHDLANVDLADLAQVKGVGRATACSIHAALQLARRSAQFPGRDKPRLQAPAEVTGYIQPVLTGKEQEEFHVLLLDAKHYLIADEVVTLGLVDRCQVHAREVFRCAIRRNCCRVILVHNHPSGDPTPSAEDIACTRNLVAAGKIIGIEVLDHVVLGQRSPSRSRGFVSFREENLL